MDKIRCKCCNKALNRNTKKYFYTKYNEYCRGCILYKYLNFGSKGQLVTKTSIPIDMKDKLKKVEKKLYNRLHYKKNKDKYKERNINYRLGRSLSDPNYNKRYYDNNKEQISHRMRLYYAANRNRTRARAAVTNALNRGIISKPTLCSSCSSKSNIEAHHYDYNKPLDVMWLCRKCHIDIHHK